MADPVTNTDKLKVTATHAKEAGEAVLGAAKKFLVGSKDKASGAAGGVLGFIKEVGNKAFGIANGTADIAFKTVKRFPVLTGAAITIGAVMGVKKWMEKRDKTKELEALQKSNELAETNLANNAVEAQLKAGKMGGKPNAEFDVPGQGDGNTAAKMAAARAAQAQMANAR